MKNIVIKYGIRSAITIVILFLLALTLGKNLGYGLQEVIGYASMVISLLFVFFGIKHFRDNENHGVVSFGKALLIGLLITLFAALAFGIINLIYIKYINPDFTTEYYARSIEQLKSSLTGVELETKLAEMESQKELFMNPYISFLLMSFTVFLVGLVISLISSLILQRKQN
ncbi:MAG: DUF4199 domain-containing protein [Flavobacteriaceae bacterium]|nr:DUF4199 domain-containing protein [Flavobacteriaceae bacterium]